MTSPLKPRNKTIAVWLALLAGPMGLHRFYLGGWRDRLGWALCVPTIMGVYGITRLQQFGVDDQWSWVLIPLVGFTFAGCALTAIVYGLMAPESWNARFNRSNESNPPSGTSSWLTIGAVVLAMLVGATVLIATIAFTFQHYFEFQMQQAPQTR